MQQDDLCSLLPLIGCVATPKLLECSDYSLKGLFDCMLTWESAISHAAARVMQSAYS